ncbi:chloride channel [Stachybotrys elegans]|uniref:Chloride channel n=1 Tax=Stachybotrys elegans TaxID=80388 RepID=A0A8K0SLL4_9HYPO|nr:chloride channel [Stachybotrys elegans]
MPGVPRNESFPSASSSSHSLNANISTPLSDDRDELDFLGHDAFINAGPSPNDARSVLADDPLHGDLTTPLSFKRHQRSATLAVPSRILSAFTGSSSGARSAQQEPAFKPRRRAASMYHGNGPSPSSSGLDNAAKDSAALDWHVEGPGRRVGYEDLTAIDWIFEYTKERQRLRVLTSRSGKVLGLANKAIDASQVWIILLLTGLLVGTVAAGIDVATNWLGDLKRGYCSSGPEGGQFYLNKDFCCQGYDTDAACTGWRPWSDTLGVHSVGGKWFIEYLFFLIFSVALAYFSSTLVQEYAIYAKHSGIPEIKTVLGGFVIRGFFSTWTLVTKSLGLILAVGSGMWLGKEGPLVHVACCCANLFIKPFKNINDNEARKREVLSAAAASGISVAFGSPIGGVLFSLEQLSYYFPDKTMWQSFVCAMTAAVALQAFDPFRSGKLVLFQTKYSTDWYGFELIPYAALGVFGGIYGGLFIKANMAVARWKKSQKWLPSPVVQVLAVALLTALINYPNFYMKVQATQLVSSLFAECSQVLDDQIGLCEKGAASASTIVLLLFAATTGFFLAAITFGLQLPAGVILPTMAIGALVGRAVGIVMEIWVHNYPDFFVFQACEPDIECVTPATYAIIGAAAALAGVTRMTVSIVVIMFELTGALTYVLPIMVAVMISKWIGDAFSRRGIYESWIYFNEYPYLDNSEEMMIPDVPTSQVMTRIEDLVVITATGHTIASLNEILLAHPYRGFPTETFFSHQPMADPRTTLDLRPWMDQTPLTLPSRTNLHLAVSYFQKLGLRYLLFSDRGALQGLLTRKDASYVLNGAEETRRTSSIPGVVRESEDEDRQGLLRGENVTDDEDEDRGHTRGLGI